jgi:predicted CXXCH cytochrome family protein
MLVYAALVAFMAPMFGGCGSSSSDDALPVVQDPGGQDPGGQAPVVPTFSVTDTAGEPVAGATVFAIPVADVEALSAVSISRDAGNFGNYSAEGLSVDEPLEDLINGNFAGSNVATYKQAVTDADGKAEITDLPTGETDKFFIYVQPATEDAHLPGGSLCREPVTGASLDDKVTVVKVSTNPSAAATFVGTSTCLACHPEQAGVKKTMHRNGFMAPGAPSPLQDLSEFDADDAEYDLGAALAKYGPGDATSGGTTIWFYDYDSTRKFDKFKTLESEPASGTVYATVRIYSNGGKYWAKFTNVINPADPNSGMTHEIVLTYGGGVYKQRPITKVDDSLFMIPLQFNARGDDASADRTRKNWRDYHMDWWWNAADSTFKSKPGANVSVDVQCAPCHFNGFELTEKTGGYFQATGVADANGETHPVLGAAQELNIGCETCHGPGSEHVAAAGAGKAIVSPQNLTPERESMLCGQCHSRPQGNGTFKNDSPLDANNRMMLAGSSRAAFLANNVSRQDSAAGDMWGDGLHSKSHHQQYTDFIQTAKYRNGSKFLTCSSCHDLHGPGTDRHQLSGASDNSLCLSCHADVVIADHQVAKTSFNMGAGTTCLDCHVTKTSSSGAGSNPTTAKSGGTSGVKYYQGDISSHLFDVPLKTATSSASPMPVPYTDNCGFCHNMGSM